MHGRRSIEACGSDGPLTLNNARHVYGVASWQRRIPIGQSSWTFVGMNPDRPLFEIPRNLGQVVGVPIKYLAREVVTLAILVLHQVDTYMSA